jgi:serine/threonine protein kinase
LWSVIAAVLYGGDDITSPLIHGAHARHTPRRLRSLGAARQRRDGGEVYRARDTRLDRTVAIKILRDTHPDLREAKLIAALAHPHICTLFDIGHEQAWTTW